MSLERTYRVVVCGGRDYGDAALVERSLDSVLDRCREPMILIHGDCRGADRLAEKWAHKRSVGVAVYPADWSRDGKAAGPLRNQKMVDEAKPHLCVAFPGGRGTTDMTRRCEKAGIKVWRPANEAPR